MRHDNIVEVIAFSVGDAVHPPCLVMERMDESLYELLSLQLTINFPWALGIIHDVCKVSFSAGQFQCTRIPCFRILPEYCSTSC